MQRQGQTRQIAILIAILMIELRRRQKKWSGRESRFQNVNEVLWGLIKSQCVPSYKLFRKMPPQVYPEDYSCILDPIDGKGGLFIGNLEAAQNLNTLKKHQIKAVLTAAKGVELGHSRADVPYFLYIPGEDHEAFDLSKYFHQAANYINDCLQRTNMMIHCLAGVSRSVTLVLAFFIKHRKYSYQQAFDLVKSRRRIIHPNEGFIQHLRNFQKQLASQEPKSVCSSPSKRPFSRENGLSFSPTKKYAPSKEIQAIISKYQNYKNLAYNSMKKNPETLDLKKIQSSETQASQSPEKSCFRAKRVASMNVDRQAFLESKNQLYDSRNDAYSRKRIGSQYNPLESIQNKPSGMGSSVSDIDKKIQQIRRKYQEYQNPGVSGYSRFSSNVNENMRSSLYENDYMKFVRERRDMVGEVSTTRLRRAPTFQEY